MTHVLVLTTEPLPLPGNVTTGAGLRAWGLAEGLRAAGLRVTIGTPIYGDDDPADPPPEYAHVRFFRRNAIGTLLHDVAPQVVVLQHWGMAEELPELSVPLVIDLAGPHLLERRYWGSSDPDVDLEEKLSALRRADFVTCSGFVQRQYFLQYLRMAGYDPDQFEVPVIPFSLPPACNEPPRPRHDNFTFIYGGAFLAWQDPTCPIEWLLDELDKTGSGRLLFYGGSHPVIDASGGRFTQLMEKLTHHPRVETRGWKPFEELLDEYRNEGDVALDLMARNPERELAFTTRTMIYLYCGLPVIYNDYSELSQIICEAGAGWTLNPDDEQAFRGLIRRLINGDENIAEYQARARNLASQFEWTKTAAPLVEFCRSPRMREGRIEFALAHQSKLLEPGSSAAITQPLHSIRIKLRPGRFLAPFVYLATWPFALYIWFRLRRTLPRS